MARTCGKPTRDGSGRCTHPVGPAGRCSAGHPAPSATPTGASSQAEAVNADPFAPELFTEDPLSRESLRRNGSRTSTVHFSGRGSGDDFRVRRFATDRGLLLTRMKGGGGLKHGEAIVEFTGTYDSGITAENLAADLEQQPWVDSATGQGDDVDEPNDVLNQVEERRIADGGNDPLEQRLARLRPETLRHIIQEVTNEERQRALAAIEGRDRY